MSVDEDEEEAVKWYRKAARKVMLRQCIRWPGAIIPEMVLRKVMHEPSIGTRKLLKQGIKKQRKR